MHFLTCTKKCVDCVVQRLLLHLETRYFHEMNLKPWCGNVMFRLTGFEAGLVDFYLRSHWLLVLKVGKVERGFRAGGGAGVSVGQGLSGAFRPPALDFEHR